MVVRQMFTDMVDFLKKGHWIDAQTRMVSIVLQVRNNNGGVRYLCRFMFEITQACNEFATRANPTPPPSIRSSSRAKSRVGGCTVAAKPVCP